MKKISLLLVVVCTLALRAPVKELSWLALGDSITYLNDHLNETGNRVSKGYMTRVSERLPNIHFINQGHNGWTVVRIAKEIETLKLEKADVFSVFLGTNDWWRGEPLGTMTDYMGDTGTGTVFGAYRVIINKLRSLNPEATFILITPMQRSDFVYVGNAHNNAYGSYKPKNGQSLLQFADAVKEIARYEHFKVVDLYHESSLSAKHAVKFKHLKDSLTGSYRNYPYPSYENRSFNPDTDEYPYPPEAIGITYDGLHPSDKGNEIIAGKLVKILKKL